MSELRQLKNMLEQSVKKNWEKPLTNKWLLNILIKIEKNYESNPYNYM